MSGIRTDEAQREQATPTDGQRVRVECLMGLLVACIRGGTAPWERTADGIVIGPRDADGPGVFIAIDADGRGHIIDHGEDVGPVEPEFVADILRAIEEAPDAAVHS
jgi:hypothetical protein